MSIVSNFRPRPRGRHRRTPEAWAAMERRLAELEELHEDYAVRLTAADSLIGSLASERDAQAFRAAVLEEQQRTAARAAQANAFAVQPLHQPDADTLTFPRVEPITAVLPLHLAHASA